MRIWKGAARRKDVLVLVRQDRDGKAQERYGRRQREAMAEADGAKGTKRTFAIGICIAYLLSHTSSRLQ